MLSFIKRLFLNRGDERLFSVGEKLKLEEAISFLSPDESVYRELEQMLLNLSLSGSNLEIELPLKSKELIKFLNADDVLKRIKSDLEKNFQESNSEFANEPIGFKYYIGNNLLFANSVEIIQSIFHERKQVGDICYSLAVKFKEGIYYYWGW